MSWPYKYFTQKEFMCRCGCGQSSVNEGFIIKLEAMREECGFPFIVTSGFRCPDYNDKIAKTGRNGPHTTGRAGDFLASHQEVFKMVAVAAKHGMTGIGLKQKGNGRFIHLDDLMPPEYHGPRPHIWTY